MIVISSCEDHRPSGFDGFNGQDGLIAEVFELKNVDFSYNATDGYTIIGHNFQIFASDVILIYRMSGTIDSNTLFGNLSEGLFSSLKVS
jgi:hypothetical protein